MRKLFGKPKPKPVIEEDTPLPLPHPNYISGLSPYGSPPSPAKSTKSEREGGYPWTRKKQPAAIGILRALDLSEELPHPGVSPDASQYEPSIRDDKKDWKIFGERKERDGEGGGRQQDGQAELTRMIGHLTAIGLEEWALVLEVCERASSSEANAKEAIKALKREFKYAEPPAQLSAARLWGIMLQNSSQLFIHQSTSRKFLETIEDVLDNPQTVPVVRERLLAAVAGAAHMSVSSTTHREAFRRIWMKVKLPEKPDSGIPFDPDDPNFNPPEKHRAPLSSTNSHDSLTLQPNRPNTRPHKSIIPLDEDIRRLFQECKIGRGNAALLAEAVAYAKPEEMKKKGAVIEEFYARCKSSQELIFAQIPWATSGAERSRNNRVAPNELADHQESNVLDLNKDPSELTVEEQLLSALLISNEELVESLHMYEDLERLVFETDVDRSGQSGRTQRQIEREDSNFDHHSLGNLTNRSRSPSPVLPPPVTSPVELQPVVTHTNHIQNFAPPPPAPRGPRLPLVNPDHLMSNPHAQRSSPSSTGNYLVESRVRVRRVKPHPGGDPQSVKEIFHRVTEMWKNLTHQNIVPLLGATAETFELFSDRMPGGDILEYIANRPDADRLSLISDVVEGLNYLHSCDVIHGDLNGSNIFVDATGHARITDIGLVDIVQDLDSMRSVSSTENGGGVRWIAPEILNNQGTYSKEADIFSFAGVTIEVFTGTTPFRDMSPRAAILAIVRGERPSRPTHPGLTEGLWALIQRCWAQEVHLRPRTLRLSCYFGTPAWKRLIDRPLTSNERIPLITDIFSDRDEIEIVRRLRGVDAQSFVDTIDQILDSLGPQLRKKSLNTLCKICGRQALLPRSLQIPLFYDRSNDALYSGGYADVWAGEHEGRKVAVKVLRIYATSNLGKITSRFCKEVMTWKSLHHPNVLPLLGVTMSGKHFAMISEWMENGCINEFIKANRDANRFELLKGITRGLIYMHGQGMIHGDLKGANVLVDQNDNARLADFGLLTFISDPSNPTNASSATNSGTTRWMSPELLHPEEFGFKQSRPTKKSDCYALGMVILEVLSEEPPFARDKEFIVMRKVIGGERPERPEGAWFTDPLWRTLEQCWLPQPNDRPTIEAVLECLGHVSKIWQPLPSVAGDVESDDDDSVSTISQHLPELVFDSPTSVQANGLINQGPSITQQTGNGPPKLPNNQDKLGTSSINSNASTQQQYLGPSSFPVPNNNQPPSPSFYYRKTNSRPLAGNINHPDNTPPALAGLQEVGQNVIRGKRPLPLLGRDDAIRDWQGKQIGKDRIVQQPYPQLDYLQQEAEIISAQGLTNRHPELGSDNRYNGVGESGQPPPTSRSQASDANTPKLYRSVATRSRSDSIRNRAINMSEPR